jgi:hypothetical protein
VLSAGPGQGSLAEPNEDAEAAAADALVSESLPAPRSLQRVALEGEILVDSRDSGIANKHREFSNGFSEPASR